MYSLTGETLKRTSMSMVVVCKNILKEILSHSDSRSIFYFLCVNLAFTFVELTYGAWTNSMSGWLIFSLGFLDNFNFRLGLDFRWLSHVV